MTGMVTLWSLTLAEMRSSMRLVRTWVFIVIACALTVNVYIYMSTVHSLFSSVTSATGAFAPRFQMSSFLWQFLLVSLIGMIFLAFDIRARDVRERMAEVIDSRPMSNFHLLLGRLTGIVLLVLLVSSAVVLLLAGTSFIANRVDPSLGETVEPYSLLSFLALDLAPNLLLCGSVTLFLALAVKLRFVVLLIMVGILFGYTLLAIELPVHLLKPLSSLTTDVIVPSDVAPNFMNGLVLWQRASAILLAIGFLFLSATLYPRIDSVSKLTSLSFGFVFLLIGGSIRAALVTSAISTGIEHDRMANVHKALSSLQRADITHLAGDVRVLPGDDMYVDYEITFVPPPDGHVVFAFNHGFKIEELTLDAKEYAFDFKDGLIRLQISSENPDATRVLGISAKGDLDTNFGYFDSFLDLYAANARESRSLAQLGTEHAVNHNDYLALTPGIKWYPTAGPAFAEERYEITPRDQFTVDLVVTVPKDWIVAGPGSRTTIESNEAAIYRFAPDAPVTEVGLFGAQFVRRATEIAGVEFEVLFSPKHTRNLELFSDVMPELSNRVGEMLERAEDMGIGYPYTMFSVVEVPRFLRIYGGGLRMPSIHALPGIFLVRETGFPSTRFVNALNASKARHGDNISVSEMQYELLATYFENDVIGGNPFIGATRNFLNFQTYPTGSGATAMAYLTNALALRLLTDRTGFFSTHFVGSQLSSGEITAISIGGRFGSDSSRSITHTFRERVTNRPRVWQKIQSTALADLDFDSDPRIASDALTLKGDAVADALVEVISERKIGEFLGTLHKRYAGSSYTIDDFNQIQHELDIDFNSIVGDWLFDSNLPGFRIYEPEVLRLPDDDNGQPVYQTTFYLTNEEPAQGLVKLSYDEQRQDDMSNLGNQVPVFHLAKNSNYQIALHSEYPISRVRLHPYLSLNRRTLEVEVDERRSWNPENVVRLPLISSVDWRPDSDDSIVVDDLDEGFRVEGDRKQPFEYSSAYLWFLEANQGLRFTDPEFDQGLPVVGQFMHPSAYEIWWRQNKRKAWGRYRKTAAIASQGEGKSEAIFKAELPYTGLWKLEYHVPVGETIGIGERTSRQLDDVTAQIRYPDQRKVGSYFITIHDGERSIPIDFDVSNAAYGWNQLGEFDLNESEVEVSIDDRGEMWVYADAIRWSQSSRSD